MKKIFGFIFLLGSLLFCLFVNNGGVKVSTALKYPTIKNRRFFSYLKKNERPMLKETCVSEGEAFEHYNNAYKQIVTSVQNMYRQGYIEKSGKKLVFGLLKKGELNELYLKVKNLNLLRTDSAVLAEKEYLTALAGELNFLDKNSINNSFGRAISLNLFNVKYHFARSEFLFKNCNFDDAIDGLLTAKSVVANSNDVASMYKNYKLLGDIYFVKGDYENSLAYYTNALILENFHENQKNKFDVLFGIGRIMYFRGDLSESINYYRYAAGLNKNSKVNKIKAALALSNTYHVSGDYENSLMYADLAIKKLGKNDDGLLKAKAYLLKCLNYSRMSEQKMLEKYCNATMKSILERYKRNDDFEINDLLGFVFGNASFFMDKTMSERYYLTALDLAEENVVKKISVLEKLADLYVDSDVDKNVVSDMVNEINKYRKQYGFNHNYGNDFILGKLGTYFGQNGNFYYIKAERGLKNEKTRLFKLYSHLSNFYADIDVNLAKKYKEKAVRLSEQLYKYGSRDIDYARSLLVRPTA